MKKQKQTQTQNQASSNHTGANTANTTTSEGDKKSDEQPRVRVRKYALKYEELPLFKRRKKKVLDKKPVDLELRRLIRSRHLRRTRAVLSWLARFGRRTHIPALVAKLLRRKKRLQ